MKEILICDYRQERAVANGLDVKDLCILRSISNRKIYSRKWETVMIDNKIYHKIEYEDILDDLPILNITTDTLYRRLRNLVKKGILESKLISNDTGAYTFYRFTDKYLKMILSGGCDVCSMK